MTGEHIQPIAHGRTFNFAHLAILSACLWTFISFGIIFWDITWAAVACWPDLRVSPNDLGQWIEWEQRHGERHPAATAWLADVNSRQDEIAAHYRQVRDGYAFVMTCSLTLLGLMIVAAGILTGSYVFEGLKARRINADGAAERNRDRLLNEAQAALPPGFPSIRLRIARATFLRYRFREGVTAYLHDALFVFLRRGHVREFQFVLTHELFHLRCFDPWFNALAKAFRRILVILVPFTFFFAISNQLTLYKPPLAWFTIPLGLLLSYVVARHVRRFDTPFLMHKELIADAFAAKRNPGADVTRVYRNPAPPSKHPPVTQRIRYLLSGASDTACRGFFAPQELIAFCVVSVPTVYDDPDWTGPKLGMLALPGAVLALIALFVLAFEAWRTPVPETRRIPMLTRGGVALLVCSVIAILSRPYYWFVYAQLALIALVMMRVAAMGIVMRMRTATVSNDAPPAESQPQMHAGMTTNLANVFRGARISWKPRQVFRIVTLTLSWYALVYAVFTASLEVLFGFSVRLFENEVPFVAQKFVWWRNVVSFMAWVVVIVAAARNVKRPAILSLAIEWGFYALGTHGFIQGGLSFFRQINGRSSVDFAATILQLPWNDLEKLKMELEDGNLGLVILLSAIPQIAIVCIYVIRSRAVLIKNRKERLNGTTE